MQMYCPQFCLPGFAAGLMDGQGLHACAAKLEGNNPLPLFRDPAYRFVWQQQPKVSACSCGASTNKQTN